MLSTRLRLLMLATDLGFTLYWAITLLHVVPPSLLYQDYDDPILVAWNVSFLPIDLLVSASGITALVLSRKKDLRALPLAIVSLTLTSTSGLMAVAFWTLRRDFELGWWAPNLFLLLYPLAYLPALVSSHARRVTA